MRYWLTVHWPPYDDSRYQVPLRLWLTTEHNSRGQRLSRGDRVLIYQTKSGPAIIDISSPGRLIHCTRGKGGIIAVAEVGGPEYDPNWRDLGGHTVKRMYEDGKKRVWSWQALTLISNKGFVVPLDDVIFALGYKPGYTMRGFGGGSGLKEISRSQYEKLAASFLLR